MSDDQSDPEAASRRTWLQAVLPGVVTVLGLGLAVTMVVGVVLWAISSPAADVVFGNVLPGVFFAFGVASGLTVLARRARPAKHRQRGNRDA